MCMFIAAEENLQQVKYTHVRKLKQILKSCFNIQNSQTETWYTSFLFNQFLVIVFTES